MQTRAELYDTIGLHDYEALDHSIVQNHHSRWNAAELNFSLSCPTVSTESDG